MFEEYYIANDDDYRTFGTTYREQSKRYDENKSTLDEQYTLIEYKIRVITRYVDAVDDETDEAMLKEYNHLCRLRADLKIKRLLTK